MLPDARAGLREPKAFHQIACHISVNIFALLFKYTLPASRLHTKFSVAEYHAFSMLDDLAAVPDGQAPLVKVVINFNAHINTLRCKGRGP
jgi:hypothetical protein